MSMISAQQFEDNEEYEKAFEEYLKVHETRPNDKDVLERLGHLSVILNKPEDAEKYYNQLLQLDPKNEMAYMQLMDIYISTDKYKYYVSRGNRHIINEEFNYAISDYKKALGATSDEEQMIHVRFVLATLYERIGKYNNAVDEYLRVTESDFAHDIAFINLAKMYIEEDALTSAIETLERAIDKGIDSDAIREFLASLYLRTDNAEKTRELTNNDFLKIKSYLEEGNNDKAFELLENIGNEYKKFGEYYILLAQYYFNKQDWDSSFKYISEYANTGENPALVYQMRALIYEEKNQDFNAHLNWARYNLARGNREVALNEYYMALKEKNDSADLLREIAELLDDMGDRVQAGEFWESLVKLKPDNQKALERLAEFKESIGAYKEQLDILEKLYEINKTNLKTIKSLAMAYEKNKQKQSALEYYKKYLEKSAINDEYHQIEAKVKKLENTVDEPTNDEGLIGKIMNLFSKK